MLSHILFYGFFRASDHSIGPVLVYLVKPVKVRLYRVNMLLRCAIAESIKIALQHIRVIAPHGILVSLTLLATLSVGIESVAYGHCHHRNNKRYYDNALVAMLLTITRARLCRFFSRSI